MKNTVVGGDITFNYITCNTCHYSGHYSGTSLQRVERSLLSKFLQKEMSACYNGNMIKNNNTRMCMFSLLLGKTLLEELNDTTITNINNGINRNLFIFCWFFKYYILANCCHLILNKKQAFLLDLRDKWQSLFKLFILRHLLFYCDKFVMSSIDNNCLRLISDLSDSLTSRT